MGSVPIRFFVSKGYIYGGVVKCSPLLQGLCLWGGLFDGSISIGLRLWGLVGAAIFQCFGLCLWGAALCM